MTMTATLSDLPDLRADHLDGQPITIRVSARDRERLERAAAELGVPASRLLRAADAPGAGRGEHRVGHT